MKNEKIKKLITSLFKKNGQPYNPTTGQAEIFKNIINPYIKRLWITAPTRYGKSEIAAMALLFLASVFKLKINIVGGTLEKAKKIMDYVLEHISDNYSFYQGLINLSLKDIETLKIERSKISLRWKDGGWISILSLDERNKIKEGEGVVGEGADIVFVEEAGLIKTQEVFSKVIRMPEGEIKKLIMSGNCFENSIFEAAYNNKNYFKVKISLDQAINEGRINKDELENLIKPEMTTRDFKRFYLLEFPKTSEFAYFKPKRYEILPELKNIYGAVDLSLGEKLSNYSAIIVLGQDEKNQIYEAESIIGRYNPDEVLNNILNLPYKFNRFGIEDVYFQRYFKMKIEQKSKELGKFIPFEGIKQSKEKLKRIESLEPFINTGQILFKGNNELWKELSEYPETEFLDGLDALEMAFRYFINDNTPKIRRL